MFRDEFESPIGVITLVWEGEALCALDFGDHEPRMQRLWRRHHGAVEPAPHPAPAHLRDSLNRYFAGDLDALDSIPVRTEGTPFQELVWTELRRIPPGRTLSYGELAQRIGKPRAVRAVGLANGSNPVGIVVPCHRVIGADGSLTGYGGGLERKRWLLAHEGHEKFSEDADLPLFAGRPRLAGG